MENYYQNDNISVSVSIVSHGQSKLVKTLLEDLQEFCDSKIEVILTLNIEEELFLDFESFSFTVYVIRNLRPKGFSANHNSAFAISSGKYFCILNPDIRLINNPFPALIATFNNKKVGVAAPKVVNTKGDLEDSVRPFPNPISILAKILTYKNKHSEIEKILDKPYWVAGMFMLINNTIFKSTRGFDERYFLYYEDVDLCARLRFSGYKIAYCPDVTVVHEAQRKSHSDLRYLRRHLSSMARYFTSIVFLKTLLNN